MYRAMLAEFSKADIVIMCAAVCDHRPKKIWREKIKKHEFPKTVEFEKTDDILYELGKNKGKNQKLIGFAAETENCENNAIDKLKRKNLDWIALNDISKQGIGFQSDFNQLTLFSRDKREILLEHSSKEKLAKLFFEKIIK
jgi:phosphopantothenoylcysteine decarboxylase/phosphopantothenate--cysteine ligase